MKKSLKTLVLVVSLATITACANASTGMGNSSGGMNNRPPRFEKITVEDFYAGLNVTSSVKAKIQVILDDFKTSFESKLKSSQMPPAREEIEPLVKARDSKIKPLLTDSQYETYKKTVEGLFAPDEDQRPPRQ
ncbi:hypothetical protein [uncultured Ilyobacter sp.]|uniref:hypothetical protein n=1 Tax=uncultured Ilyobacter sp. TaxID=544433 RepID=UPI002AA67026|nr:hypothetical protein [uncultured Ilyobacter sp.]